MIVRILSDYWTLDDMMLALRAVVLVCAALVGLWLTRHVWNALRSGTANVHNQLVRRRAKPVYYWSAVAAQTGFAAMCFFAVAMGFTRWISEW